MLLFYFPILQLDGWCEESWMDNKKTAIVQHVRHTASRNTCQPCAPLCSVYSLLLPPCSFFFSVLIIVSSLCPSILLPFSHTHKTKQKNLLTHSGLPEVPSPAGLYIEVPLGAAFPSGVLLQLYRIHVLYQFLCFKQRKEVLFSPLIRWFFVSLTHAPQSATQATHYNGSNLLP